MIKGGWRSVGFLAATAVVVTWECVASWDDDSRTLPWTDLIVTYIPGEVAAVLLGALIAWLPVHFGLRYYRKSRDRRDGSGGDDDPSSAPSSTDTDDRRDDSGGDDRS